MQSLYSVDNDPKALDYARKALMQCELASDRVRLWFMDSIGFLRGFSGPIDLLYLDSMDFPYAPGDGDPAPSQQHCLAELTAAMPNLSPRAVVMIDDNHLHNGGKPFLAKRHLKQLGWECLADEWQTVWQRPR
jgi:hypothetical protein